MKKKRLLCAFLAFLLLFLSPAAAWAEPEAETGGGLSVSAPSVILLEASTGTVIYENNADQVLHPASITKIMTLILIYDALAEGKIHKDDVVRVSEYAASMGGSQVFLEEGEEQTVDTMMKCISVASANDACVAMAEFVWGSETAFVEKMNERAAGLGMANTTFVNCCGLDVEGHMTTARDVALMSRELITKYPDIFNYTSIWMENITHVTARGSSEFGLTNTNKLMKQYTYATGLKTGSTGLAKYCVSATARKDGVDLIAVVMAAPDYKVRFKDAITLLEYGFSTCRLYQDTEGVELPELLVTGGVEENLPLALGGTFSYLSTTGEDFSGIEKNLELPENLAAPVEEGQVVGKLRYQMGGKELGSVDILAGKAIEEAGFLDYLKKAAGSWLL
jgi:D-alanyl-D-alanine carboxypeptidase (penicillin-binding protein 5/6)